jgi:hypothetical protein
MADRSPTLVGALTPILTELIDGAASDAGWLLNPSDPGLLRSLDRLSAADASARPDGGHSSVAAQVDHLRYGLAALNRWTRGEDAADTDYSASWRRVQITDDEWRRLKEELRRELYAWREALEHPRDFREQEVTTLIAGVVHLAYHLGAMRQIHPALRGPSARD